MKNSAKKTKLQKQQHDVTTKDVTTKSVTTKSADTPEPNKSESGAGTKGGMAPMLDRRRLLAGGVVAVLVVGAIATLTSFGDESTPANVSGGLTPEEAQQEVEELLEKVGKHILLPEDEIPLVATVIDSEALVSEQPFYTGVQDDDRLIIYGESLKAIIYSPERDIVVNVGPVQLASPTEGEIPAGTEAQ